MPTLTPIQVGLYMHDVGWWQGHPGTQVTDSGSVKVVDTAAKNRMVAWIDTVLAVMQAESGFNPNARNGSSSASGLMQIMVSVHGDLIAQQSAYWKSELGTDKAPTVFEPHVNLSCAQQLHRQSGWKPWEAYNTGAYKRYLNSRRAESVYRALFLDPKMNADRIRELTEEIRLGKATAQLGGILAPGGVLLNNDLTQGVGAYVSQVLEFLASAGIVAGAFLGGVLLVVIGMWALLSRTSAAKSVRKVAKATPVGKVLA